jgi:class 3 adenylate cyclase/tetratricopeptide (TPR) repeat protein
MAENPRPVVEPAASAAERRQLTIMFCDLVGSTALSARLDPEDLRDLIREYHASASAEIRRYDGFVAKLSGDGIMAYFGYPQAHEDDAERAVLAGLAIVDAVRSVRPPADAGPGAELVVRIGVATGNVVVGDLVGESVSERWAVVGETPNLAARLQAVAEPNSLVVSARTRQLAPGGFRYHSLGLRELKGLPSAVEIWQVTGKKATQSRFDAVHGKVLTPMIGREQELELLQRCWRRATAGEGQVVVIRGEPGIGKSRITQCFYESIENEPHRRLYFQCSPYHVDSALHPVISQIEHAAKLSSGDDAETKHRKLEALLGLREGDRGEALSLIASLLSIPADGKRPKLALDPQEQRKKTLAVLLARLEAMTREAPLVCIVEDLHWIDPSTLDLLRMVVDRASRLRLLLIITSRPEFEAPWRPGRHVTEIQPPRMTAHRVKEIVAGVTVGKALPDELLSQIVAKADGVPLFVEELTKTVLDAGVLSEDENRYVLAGSLPKLAIPTTLHDSLMARLDRLPAEKSVAQIAAVIGRAFDYELLSAVAGLPKEELTRALARLEEAELIFQREPPPTPSFEFKHALIQDAAYQSQLKSVRRTHHESIARALEQRFPLIASTQPELIAHHYTEAGCVDQALKGWMRAGTRANERSANVEALRHFERALQLLPRIESAEERARQELPLQLARGMTLTAVEGYATPAVEHAYARALELCQEVGSDPQKFAALFGSWRIAITRPDLGQARTLAVRLLELAQRLKAGELILTAHGTVGITFIFLGEPAAAEESLRQVIALYDPVAHRALAIKAGQDPGIASMMYLALGLWLRGRTDEALDQYRHALERARALDHPFTLGYTLHVASIIEHCVGNLTALRERAIELEQLSAEKNFAQLHAGASVFLGLCDAEQERSGSIARIEQGIADYQASSGLNVPYFRGILGHACGRSGELERGLAAIDEALASTDATQVRWYRPELLRLKAELLSRRAAAESDIRACFERALVNAREQGALSWERKALATMTEWLQRAGAGAQRDTSDG